MHPRRFIRSILFRAHISRREDTVGMRAAVKDGRLVELLRMACSSFLSSQQKQPFPSVCLFPAGLNVTLNDQFPCETNRTVTVWFATVACVAFFLSRFFFNLFNIPRYFHLYSERKPSEERKKLNGKLLDFLPLDACNKNIVFEMKKRNFSFIF